LNLTEDVKRPPVRVMPLSGPAAYLDLRPEFASPL